MSRITYLPHRKEVLQPFCEITFHTWQNLIAYGFAAASPSWGNHSNPHAEKGKLWHNISAAHFQSVCADENRKGSIRWFVFSLCLVSHFLQTKEILCLKHCVCGRPSGEKKNSSEVLQTFTPPCLWPVFSWWKHNVYEREREREG